jgi:hypothetical protein
MKGASLVPTPPLEEPHKKVTLNIWAKDYEFLKANYERWSEKVREIVHDFVRSKNRMFKDD